MSAPLDNSLIQTIEITIDYREKGDRGPMPRHIWEGTSLSFEKPDGSFDEPVDLKGFNGWSPETEIDIVNGRTLRKLIGWFGGTGEEPDLYVNFYEAEGGWVENPEDAIDLVEEVSTAAIEKLTLDKADKSEVTNSIEIWTQALLATTAGQTVFNFPETIGYFATQINRAGNVTYTITNGSAQDTGKYFTHNPATGDITVPTGLSLGEFIKVRYRRVGDPIYVPVSIVTSAQFQPFKDYIDNYLKQIFTEGAEGYAYSATDSKSRLLFYSLINGAFGATKWDPKNIPGSALKDGEVSRSNLNADVLSGLWQPLDPETGYLWAFLDKKNGIFWAVRTDGSFEVGKWSDNNIPGRALKEATIGLSKLSTEVTSGLWQPLDPATGYINAILDAKKRKIVAATTDGWFEISKLRALNFEYTLPDNSVSSQKLTQDLRDLINTGGTNSKVWFIGQKLVTLGDSITEQKRWQEYLVILTKMVWSSVETAPGLPIGPAGALVKMGYGGQTVRPVISSDGTTRPAGGSLYYRADYVQALAPDVIIVFGGQNDSPVESVVGTINDPVYTGAEVAAGDPNEPTFCSSYKGMMVKLMTQNPNARIYAMTRMWNGVFPTVVPTPTQKAGMDRINNAIRAICDLYSIPVIDLAKGIGITPYNASIFYSDSVHPNYEGGLRMANFIANNLN